MKDSVHSVYHGTESLSFEDPKIWNLMPLELKQLESLPMENKEMDSLRMPLQIVSSLYTTSWVCFSQKDWPWSLIALIIFFFYHLRCLYNNIYKQNCQILNYLFNLTIYLPVFVSFAVLLEVFSHVPIWRIDNNFKCLYQIILV